MSTTDDTSAARRGSGSNDLLGLVDPAGFRTRYRSEPGMIGHYPWTYADQRRRRVERPECETEDLYTADQVRAMLAAERERCAALCESAPFTGNTFPVTQMEQLRRDIAAAILGPNVRAKPTKEAARHDRSEQT